MNSKQQTTPEPESPTDGDGQQAPGLIIVSGLSGSGKSTALQALEDQGYFCIDNLPVKLITPLLQQQRDLPQEYPRLAIGLDARSKRTFELASTLDELQQRGQDLRLLFLTASDTALLQRYNATRRDHPLADASGLQAAISRERDLLAMISEYASDIIDTSLLNVHELRQKIAELTSVSTRTPRLLLQSFAYTLGLPPDLDIVFDTRCLPNPHWQPGLRQFTGKDQAVREFLQQAPLARQFIDDISQLLLNWLPHYSHSTRSQIAIGFGCTGGRHRSVFATEALAERLRASYRGVSVRHRDIKD
ncbi:MAG: RNase adapter RapZ [Gammaproteobacteria bacterium]|nr:RNase adapter RapZ [Gammaproteobacteria bacterium]